MRKGNGCLKSMLLSCLFCFLALVAIGCGNFQSPTAGSTATESNMPENGLQTLAKTTASMAIYYNGTKTVQGKKYFVYLQVYCDRGELWFRTGQNMCSSGDLLVLTVYHDSRTIKKGQTLVDVAKALCNIKRIYDGGKMAVGCASTGITGVCLIASVPTEGGAALVCSASIGYTVKTGLVDCVRGIVDWIGSKIAGDAKWAIVAAQYNVNLGKWDDVISYAIDAACSQVR
jgi:hypothetical protein